MSKPTTTYRGFTKIASDNPDYEANSFQLDHDANFDAIDAAMALATYSGATGHVAIANKEGVAILTKSTAGAYTLAQPTAGTDDGKVLTCWSATAQAHTITTATNGINGADKVATFGGAIGDKAVFRAYNAVWYLDADMSTNITLAAS